MCGFGLGLSGRQQGSYRWGWKKWQPVLLSRETIGKTVMWSIIKKAENIPTDFMALGEVVLKQNTGSVSKLLLTTYHKV